MQALRVAYHSMSWMKVTQSVKESRTDSKIFGEVCSVKDTPYRIFKAAENGDLEEFRRLYLADSSRIKYTDSRGKYAIHFTAAKNHVNIIEFIVSQNGDLNAQDCAGNTALHYAVESNSLEALSCLLKNGADCSLLNHDLYGPIHLATQFNRIEILEEMVKFKGQVCTELRGKHGRTPLHLAAIQDHAECAEILLRSLKCCPRTPCENGYYPIHEASRNASANTLKVILQFGQSIGCSKETLMTLYDADGNVPLHSAVHAGDIKAVELCLNSGAVISTQQHDLSTPAHLACAQGAIEIVKLMFASQPEQKTKCLSIGDAQNMTPLHHAALFNHPDLVEYLVSQGADMNCEDQEGRSVLLLAGARAAWRSLVKLIQLGADLWSHDQRKRNILHHIVISGGNLEQFTHFISERENESIIELLNERDLSGCTPMHYASKDGHLRTIQSLLHLGAVINVKDILNQSPLHFAAKFGRYNTVKFLLESRKGHLIINEMDGEGMTALHIASQSGHTKVVQLLTVKGALLHRDHKGRTPLHYAAGNDFTKTMHQLMLVHSHLLDQSDRDGNTPLHLAVVNNKPNAASFLLTLNCKIKKNSQGMSAIDYALHHKHSEVTLALVMHPTRSDEITHIETKGFKCLIDGLTATMPQVMTAVLNKAITKSTEQNEDSKMYFVKYDFRCLQCPHSSDSENGDPLPVMNLMVRYRREELMSHPLCIKYLETKWNSYGMYWHLMNLGIYTVFLFSLTLNTIELMHDNDHEFSAEVDADVVAEVVAEVGHNSSVYSKQPALNEPSNVSIITAVLVLIFSVLNIFREFVQIYHQKLTYLTDCFNVIEWVLYKSSGLTAIAVFLPDLFEPATIHILAAVAVFMAWFNYLLYLQRFNPFGIYVVMFLEILSTLIRVLFVFSVLIIAFGLSFYILMANIKTQSLKGFDSPSMSMIRVSTMMLGEIDFLSTFLLPLKRITTPVWAQMAAATWFLVAFAVLMPILLMNLLIGLAVGDIDTVRRNASMKRLTMQVQMHSDLERRLPQQLLRNMDKMEVQEFPNKKHKVTYLWSTLQAVFMNHQDDHKNRPLHPNRKDSGYPSTSDCFSDLTVELHKQRNKLREVSKVMDQQLQLIRLIVCKMGIHTENAYDDYHENDGTLDQVDSSGEPHPLGKVHLI